MHMLHAVPLLAAASINIVYLHIYMYKKKNLKIQEILALMNWSYPLVYLCLRYETKLFLGFFSLTYWKEV